MEDRKKKVFSYLGFAARARKLATGYNTCIYMMEKHKVRLLLLAEDLSANSAEKMEAASKKNRVPYRVFGTVEELSKKTGNIEKGIYGVLDENFAKVILEWIDSDPSR